MNRQLGGFPDVQNIGLNFGGTGATFVGGAGTANTKGAWTELAASAPFDAEGFWIYTGGHSTDIQKNFLVDVALGGAGVETAILSNFWTAASMPQRVWVPLQIPAGQRVSARAAGDTAGTYVRGFHLTLVAEDSFFANAPLSEQLFDAADAASSQGTLIGAPGGANAKSGWTQLVASTSRICRHLLVQAAAPNSSNGEHIFDIGIGGAGAEVVLIPDLYFDNADFAAYTGMATQGFHVDLPAASRLSVRQQSQRTDGDGQMRINVLGFG